MVRRAFPRVLTSSLVLASLLSACDDDPDFNFGGTVTLDGEPAPNVGLVIVSETNSRLNRRTDEEGVYQAFLGLDPTSGAETATYEVSITGEGLPTTSICLPFSPQSVVVPGNLLPEPATVDFSCTSLDGGMGGQGGDAGSGGMDGTGGVGGGGSGGSGTTGLEGCDAVNTLDAECECDPLSPTACDQPSSNLECSHTLYVGELGAIVGIPTIDGSEGAWTTECVSDFVQEDGAGASCFITAGSGMDGSAPTRRDTCIQGFHCENPDGGEQGTCVPLCASANDCGGGSCALFEPGASGVTLGRCL